MHEVEGALPRQRGALRIVAGGADADAERRRPASNLPSRAADELGDGPRRAHGHLRHRRDEAVLPLRRAGQRVLVGRVGLSRHRRLLRRLPLGRARHALPRLSREWAPGGAPSRPRRSGVGLPNHRRRADVRVAGSSRSYPSRDSRRGSAGGPSCRSARASAGRFAGSTSTPSRRSGRGTSIGSRGTPGSCGIAARSRRS